MFLALPSSEHTILGGKLHSQSLTGTKVFGVALPPYMVSLGTTVRRTVLGGRNHAAFQGGNPAPLFVFSVKGSSAKDGV